jgi:hypothetical protein
MSAWDFIFDSEHKQRSDINDLKGVADRVDASVDGLWDELTRTKRRVAKLELLTEGLIAYMQVKGVLNREELAVMVQRVDLSDGYEDGRIGPDRSSKCTKCPFCDRPFNEKRKVCIYCGKEVTPQDLKLMEKKEPRTIICALCYRRFPETAAHFTVKGLVCETCFGTKKSF